MPLIDCVDCGKQHSDTAPACIHCGRPNSAAPLAPPAPPAFVVPITPGPPPGGLACPKCASPDVRKLPLIWREGLSSVNTTTSGVGIAGGGIGVGSARSSGTSQTLLSQGAAPPRRRGVGGWVIAALIVPMLLSAVASGGGSVVSTLVWLLATAGFVYMIVETVKWNRNVFPELLRSWENTFLCTRCGDRFEHVLSPAAAAGGLRPAFG